ncbi:GNAT family N-acetyltransferase [Ihubacter sp. rT4E-8]|uniref:GNAT family N-acetyltransferase n=1 Tax=Ihubacter sp. rT4E-8 TaxID=3242369 RepID=UPI003CECDF77
MEIELRQLSLENNDAEYNMLQDIGANENGFTNEVNGMSFEQYKEWLVQENNYSNSQNLPDNYIPQTTYFLYVDNVPVGIARIRHYSAEFLEKQGVGNFGYGIAKSQRGKGYGNALFIRVLEKCKILGYKKTKSFVHIDNVASNKVFVNNGAILLEVFGGTKNVYETVIDNGEESMNSNF